MIFDFEGQQYTYIPFSELKEEDFPEAGRAYKSKYLNLDCAFDIETSSYQSMKLSWLYMWQFAINDITIIGRTWKEFQELLKLLGRHYQNDNHYRLLVWDHNLSYEWAFMKNWIPGFHVGKFGYPEVFAMEAREIIKLCTDLDIEFRDSLVLTNVGLKKLATDYKTGLEKLTEVMNYKEVLTPETPLDNARLAYAINDVQILAKFNKYYIKPYYLKKGYDIPLTSTAIVRNELKRLFKKLDKEFKRKYKNRIRNAFPNKVTYEFIMKWLYRGGYVHASIADTFEEYINEDMWSLDFKSSYPAVMLHNKFPWRFIKRKASEWYKICDDKKFMENNAFYVHLEFTNIRSKTTHAIESKHKLLYYENCLFDNGRLSSGDKIEVVLTEQDWLSYNDFYSWDSVRCLNYHVASKEELPLFLREMVLEYFELKEKTDKSLLDYVLIKAKLNALYGMCVSGLFHDQLVLTDDGLLEPSGIKKDYEQIVKSQILLPYFGIWISAYARRNLLSIVAKLDEDNAYSDTDSSKVFNYFGNKYIFDAYNDRIRRINNNMYVGNHDRAVYKDLGCFMLEDKYFKFRTNGCKRYIYTTSSFDKKTKKYHLEDHVTIAGMKKGSLQKKAMNENRDIYELFEDGLELDKLESDKLTSVYNDKEFTLEVTDKDGKVVNIYEKSCVTLVDIGFKMKIEPLYINLYYRYKEKEKLIVGERW